MFAQSGTPTPIGMSGVNICLTISRWQNRGSILGNLASGSMIPVAMVYCPLHTDTQKYSPKIKQKDKNTNRNKDTVTYMPPSCAAQAHTKHREACSELSSVSGWGWGVRKDAENLLILRLALSPHTPNSPTPQPLFSPQGAPFFLCKPHL